jgi:HEAT repeat protein
LNSIGHPDMGARIASLLREGPPYARESAVRIAAYFGYRECADDLVACCGDADSDVQRAALEHLGCLDDPRVLPTLLQSLASRDAVVRRAAAKGLAQVEEPHVLQPLLDATTDEDAWVRYFAARAIGEHRDARALDQLTRLAFDDAAGHVRLAAVDALGRTGHRSAIPALAALATAEDPERAEAAIRALAAVRSEDGWPPLESALREGDEPRRTAAAEAVSQLGGTAAIQLLQWTAAADVSETVGGQAILGLARIASTETDGAPAVRALVALLAEPGRREQVVESLASLPANLIDEVAHGLADQRPLVRIAVLEALARMRDVAASHWLQAALNDHASDVRLAALGALRHLGTRGLEPRLVRMAHADGDAAVRRAAMAVLKSGPRGRGSDRNQD